MNDRPRLKTLHYMAWSDEPRVWRLISRRVYLWHIWNPSAIHEGFSVKLARVLARRKR